MENADPAPINQPITALNNTLNQVNLFNHQDNRAATTGNYIIEIIKNDDDKITRLDLFIKYINLLTRKDIIYILKYKLENDIGIQENAIEDIYRGYQNIMENVNNDDDFLRVYNIKLRKLKKFVDNVKSPIIYKDNFKPQDQPANQDVDIL